MYDAEDVLAFIFRLTLFFHVFTATPIFHFYIRSILNVMFGGAIDKMGWFKFLLVNMAI